MVLSGSGRVKVEDKVIDVSQHDAIRVAAGVMRGYCCSLRCSRDGEAEGGVNRREERWR